MAFQRDIIYVGTSKVHLYMQGVNMYIVYKRYWETVVGQLIMRTF